MKKTLLITTLLAFAFMPLWAQPGTGGGGGWADRDMSPEKRAQASIQRMEASITDFSDDQREAMQEVYTEFFVKMRNVRQAAMDSGERPGREAMELPMKERDEAVKTILTDSQYAEYEAFWVEQMGQRREQVQERKRKHRGGKPAEGGRR